MKEGHYSLFCREKWGNRKETLFRSFNPLSRYLVVSNTRSRPQGIAKFRSTAAWPKILHLSTCSVQNRVVLKPLKNYQFSRRTQASVQEEDVFCCCFYRQEITQFQTRQVQVGYSQAGVNSLNICIGTSFQPWVPQWRCKWPPPPICRFSSHLL